MSAPTRVAPNQGRAQPGSRPTRDAPNEGRARRGTRQTEGAQASDGRIRWSDPTAGRSSGRCARWARRQPCRHRPRALKCQLRMGEGRSPTLTDVAEQSSLSFGRVCGLVTLGITITARRERHTRRPVSSAITWGVARARPRRSRRSHGVGVQFLLADGSELQRAATSGADAKQQEPSEDQDMT